MIDYKPLTLFELLSLIVSAFGFLTVIVTLIFLTRQTREMARQTRLVVKSIDNSQMTSINEMFIANPDLRPYFYDNKDFDHSDREGYYRLSSVGDTLLDIFESRILHKSHLDDGQLEDVWDSYITSVFATSPFLRHYLKERQHWYISSLSKYLEQGIILSEQSRKKDDIDAIGESKVKVSENVRQTRKHSP